MTSVWKLDNREFTVRMQPLFRLRAGTLGPLRLCLKSVKLQAFGPVSCGEKFGYTHLEDGVTRVEATALSGASTWNRRSANLRPNGLKSTMSCRPVYLGGRTTLLDC